MSPVTVATAGLPVKYPESTRSQIIHAGSLVGEAPRDRAPEPVGAARSPPATHAVEPAAPPGHRGLVVRRDVAYVSPELACGTGPPRALSDRGQIVDCRLNYYRRVRGRQARAR